MKNRIHEARKEKGITQERLAELAGVTRQTIISLEQNRYSPSLALAFRITKSLGKKNIEEIFEE